MPRDAATVSPRPSSCRGSSGSNAMTTRRHERGMALLLVLLVVALLTTLLVEFAFSTLVDLRLTETFRDSTQAYYLAKGGVAAGSMLLKEDRNRYDSLDEMWSQG